MNKTILGVNGEYTLLKIPSIRLSPGCHNVQMWISEGRPVKEYGGGSEIRVEIRHDDLCNFGYNKFTITAEIRKPDSVDRGIIGCLHDEIKQYFPEISHLIRWHSIRVDKGPFINLMPTLYLASNKKLNGEKKERDFKQARIAANWPEATDKQLSVSSIELEKALRARGPILMAKFQADIEAIGFEYKVAV